MTAAKGRSETNLTLRVDEQVLLWARIRASFARTSVNALVREFLREYAALPEPLVRGEQWTSGERASEVFREVMDPAGAGARALIRGSRGAPDDGG
jgi:hypothetical protein